MLSQSKGRPSNRVQAIRSKFENLSCESNRAQLNKQSRDSNDNNCNKDKENINNDVSLEELGHAESSHSNSSIISNEGYLHNSDIENQAADLKKTLTRQSSDPGKKLHRRHAFRCDRSKIIGPQRHGSWNGRSETNKFSCKSDKKLSKDRLERLTNVIGNQMKKENFVLNKEPENIVGEIMDVSGPLNSIPDSQVPSHILEQYAKVIKSRSVDIEKQDGMIDSGVSSETENLEDEKSLKIKQIIGQFEKTDDTNLDSMNNLCASTETMKLERKNPHLVLTSTLKKALKQPLPAGPPPKKPPRTFTTSPVLEKPNKQKKDARKMLEKLEQVLQKREGRSSVRNNYDIAEENESLSSEGSESKMHKQKSLDSENKVQKKEMHYLCTEILDIANKTLPLPPNPLNCFKSLNCAIANNSTLSLPYTQLNSNRRSSRFCSCSSENLAAVSDRVSTFLDHKCVKCQLNGQKDTSFKCHLKCKCNGEASQFFVDKEHIYDEPFTSEYGVTLRRSHYGTLNHSKSLEDLRSREVEKIYDIPCDISRPETPEPKNSEDCEVTNSFESTSNSNEKLETKRNRASSLNLESRKRNSQDTKPSISQLNHLKSIFENNKIDLKTQDSNPKKELDLKLNFEQLRKNFESDNSENSMRKSFKSNNENSNNEENKFENSKVASKPPMKPKPMFLKNNSKSTENLFESKSNIEKGSFHSTERKCRKERDNKTGRLSLPERNAQLDMDKENLNRLMNELYETVVACSMQPSPPFPSEDSVKLSRSLTEKRKNYVRRVSSRVNYAETKNLRKPRHQTSICYYKPEKDEIVNNYSTFRSWKSFRTSQNNISKMEGDLTDSKIELDNIDNKSIDEKTGCVDIELPFEPRERALFNVCLLVGLNHMTGQAYVKSVFPKQVQVPDHIENLVFPETLGPSTGELTISAQSADSQCYSMVLTDERGERSYGYCRRVVPEGAAVCLPLCYCLIAKFRAPGFYYKILEEIESHHGSSEVEINSILQQLFESDFPDPGEEIVVTYHPPETSYRHSVNYENAPSFDINLQSLDKDYQNLDRNSENLNRNSQNLDRNSQNLDRNSQNLDRNSQNSDKNTENSSRNSKNFDQNSPNLNRNSNICNSHKNVDKNSENSNRISKNFDKCKTLPNMRKSDISDVQNSDLKSASVQLYDLQNNNNSRILLDVEGPKVKYIKRPLDPRVDESSLLTLVEALGAGLAVKVFGSLLLERKVLVCGDNLGLVSSCMEALQLSLYPFVWQQPLISCVPAQIQRDVVEAPLPILAGMLAHTNLHNYQPLEEGMLIDLTHPSKVLHYQGDESTILPAQSYRTLKTALQTECKRDRDTTSNVMISEAFLRFFVDILGDFWKYFSLGEVKEGQFGKAGVVFDTAAFIKNAPSKQNQYFLEWFTETAMFNHFVQNMSIRYRKSVDTDRKSTENDNLKLIDAPLPDFYNLFEDRLRNRTKIDANKFDKSNYKNAMNKRMKLLKLRLKELVA